MAKIRMTTAARESIRRRALDDTIKREEILLWTRAPAVFSGLAAEHRGENAYGCLQQIAEDDRKLFKEKGHRTYSCPVDTVIQHTLTRAGQYRHIRFATPVIACLPRQVEAIKSLTLRKRVDELLDAFEKMDTKRRTVELQLEAFLAGCRTYEDALEAWPEGRAYIEAVKADYAPSTATVSVPLAQIQKMNSDLGLPKDAAPSPTA
jgi:hypothetical protein